MTYEVNMPASYTLLDAEEIEYDGGMSDEAKNTLKWCGIGALMGLAIFGGTGLIGGGGLGWLTNTGALSGALRGGAMFGGFGVVVGGAIGALAGWSTYEPKKDAN